MRVEDGVPCCPPPSQLFARAVRPMINRGAYLTLPSGNEDLPTNEEMENVPVLPKDKDADPGWLDNCNKTLTIDLLPRRISEHTEQHADGRVYVGESLPPILQRVAKRIVRGDFVEMVELLPELWPAAHQDNEGKVKKNWKITDIFTWIQCFVLYTSVRGQHNPELIAELMAYMVSIVRVSRKYSGLSWVQYDALFQKHTTLKADTKWSVINTTLYTRCFTGAPREVVRCELCWATSHDTKDCLHLARADSTIEFCVQNVKDSLHALLQQRSQPAHLRLSGEICRKFNNEGCTYPYCIHAHVCMTCGGPHPEVQCQRSRRQGYKIELQPRRLIKPY